MTGRIADFSADQCQHGQWTNLHPIVHSNWNRFRLPFEIRKYQAASPTTKIQPCSPTVALCSVPPSISTHSPTRNRLDARWLREVVTAGVLPASCNGTLTVGLSI